MVLLHQGPPPAEESDAVANLSHSFLVDPTMEETQNLSNNLVLVTLIKRPTLEDAEMQIDDDESEVSGDPLVIEKVTDALRTCHTCQLSTSLNFKPNSMSIG